MAHLTDELAEMETEIAEVEEAEIEDALDDLPEDEEEFVAPQGFHVHDEESANWVIRKIAEARTRKARMKTLKQTADREIKGADKEEAFFLGRFGAELADHARQQIGEARRKSFKLLEGTLGFRKQAERLVITDESATLEWAKANCPDAITWTPRLSKTALFAHLKEQGEMPDGCEFVPEGEVFYVK